MPQVLPVLLARTAQFPVPRAPPVPQVLKARKAPPERRGRRVHKVRPDLMDHRVHRGRRVYRGQKAPQVTPARKVFKACKAPLAPRVTLDPRAQTVQSPVPPALRVPLVRVSSLKALTRGLISAPYHPRLSMGCGYSQMLTRLHLREQTVLMPR